MKLLPDENLSRRLVPFLQADFPDSTHVALIGLERVSDREIWEYARAHEFIIVTKDADYYDLSLVHGAPPCVLWLQAGNASKASTLALLLDHAEGIKAAFDGGHACVELTG